MKDYSRRYADGMKTSGQYAMEMLSHANSSAIIIHDHRERQNQYVHPIYCGDDALHNKTGLGDFR
jgi:hypothetical protein